MANPRVGSNWQHYKGGTYHIVGVGKHTETREELIAYVGEEGSLHFRPSAMWEEQVVDHERDYMGPRFKELGVRNESAQPIYNPSASKARKTHQRRSL